MGFTEPELYEGDVDVIATVLDQTGLGETFASLATKGAVPISPEPLIQFEDCSFPTPSGRVEIASARAEADGHPRLPQPFCRPAADPRPAATPLPGFLVGSERQLHKRRQGR